MTFRRVVFVLLAGFFSFMIWHVSHQQTEPARVLASALPWAIVVLMMLPVERVNVREILSGLRIWKGNKEPDQ